MNMILLDNGHWTHWTDLKVERFTTLYRDGLSFGLIAADIGVTRSAAIGKARRLQLSGALPKRTQTVACKPARGCYSTGAAGTKKPRRRATFFLKPPKPAKAVPMFKERPIAPIIQDHDYRCTIDDLTNETCRFPLWTTNTQHADRRYCGIPQARLDESIPYCRHHSRVVRGLA
jgi:hypothetical protein